MDHAQQMMGNVTLDRMYLPQYAHPRACRDSLEAVGTTEGDPSCELRSKGMHCLTDWARA